MRPRRFSEQQCDQIIKIFDMAHKAGKKIHGTYWFNQFYAAQDVIAQARICWYRRGSAMESDSESREKLSKMWGMEASEASDLARIVWKMTDRALVQQVKRLKQRKAKALQTSGT